MNIVTFLLFLLEILLEIIQDQNIKLIVGSAIIIFVILFLLFYIAKKYLNLIVIGIIVDIVLTAVLLVTSFYKDEIQNIINKHKVANNVKINKQTFKVINRDYIQIYIDNTSYISSENIPIEVKANKSGYISLFRYFNSSFEFLGTKKTNFRDEARFLIKVTKDKIGKNIFIAIYCNKDIKIEKNSFKVEVEYTKGGDRYSLDFNNNLCNYLYDIDVVLIK